MKKNIEYPRLRPPKIFSIKYIFRNFFFSFFHNVYQYYYLFKYLKNCPLNKIIHKIFRQKTYVNFKEKIQVEKTNIRLLFSESKSDVSRNTSDALYTRNTVIIGNPIPPSFMIIFDGLFYNHNFKYHGNSMLIELWMQRSHQRTCIIIWDKTSLIH